MSPWTSQRLKMSQELHQKVLSSLKSIVGNDYVTDDYVRCDSYSSDFGVVPRNIPDFVVRPKTTEEIAEIVKISNNYRVPIIPRGAGTAQEGGCIPAQGGIVIDLTRMNTILNMNEDTGRVTVEAGITYAKLLNYLEEKNWKIGIYPSGSLAGTIGGHLSKAGVGWGNIIFGTQGDQVIGVKVVLPSGEILNTSSAALPPGKTFIRYVLGPDLTGLFVGAEGALGIVTEITLAIYPLPEKVLMRRYWLPNIDTAMDLYHKISHHKLAFYISQHQSSPDVIFDIFIDGSEDEVKQKDLRILKWVQQAKGRQEKLEDPDSYYKNRFWETATYYRRGIGAMICAYAPFKESVEATKIMRQIIEKYNLKDYGVDMYPTLTMMEHAVSMYFRENDEEEKKKIRKASEEVMEEALRRGWPPYTKGRQWGDSMKKVLGKTTYWKTLLDLKKTLDPNNIMNPGVLGLPEAEDYQD
jgi:glycolate oxidase